MIATSPSTAVYEFLRAIVVEANDPADPESPLLEAQVMDSAYAEMTGDRGMLVSNSEFDLAPKQTGVDIFDAVVIIAFWAKVGGDTSERADARDACLAMATMIADQIYQHPSLGDRTCGTLIQRAVDGYRNSGSTEYAVINLPVILNPTGDPVSYNVGEVRR